LPCPAVSVVFNLIYGLFFSIFENANAPKILPTFIIIGVLP
tara:strand:- start:3288 stop:3410 length:123 start_codon:yes stop_codon:yes gene_type:complete